MYRAALVAVAAVGLLWAQDVGATPLTFAYTGQVTSVAALDPSNPFPTEPVFGTAFSGTFTFDSNATDGVPADPTTGVYTSTGGPFNLTLSLGGLDFLLNAVTVSVTNGYSSFGPGDEYLFGTVEGDAMLSVRLTDLGATMFSSDALPLTPPPLAGLFTTFFFTDIIDDNQVEIAGAITSVNAVPEPATVWLVGAGAYGLIRRRRARVS